jgi:hypothetical protein
VHTRRTRDDKPALKCLKLRKKPLVFRIQVLCRACANDFCFLQISKLLLQDKDSDVFQSSAMVLHMDDSNGTANVALVRHVNISCPSIFSNAVMRIRRYFQASCSRIKNESSNVIFFKCVFSCINFL